MDSKLLTWLNGALVFGACYFVGAAGVLALVLAAQGSA